MLARTHTEDVTIILLQVIRDLHWTEHDGDPEVAETEDEDRVRDVVEPTAALKEVSQPRQETKMRGYLLSHCVLQHSAQWVEQHRREAENRPRKDDGHDARVVHLEWQVISLRPIHLLPDHTLSILDGNLTNRLIDGHHRGGHEDEEDDHAGRLFPTMGVDGISANLTAKSDGDKTGNRSRDIGQNADGD